MLDWHIVADHGLRDSIVKSALSNAGRVQLLLGESGIGKTTLANAVARRLEDAGCGILPVVGLAELSAVPLAAMTPLLARAQQAGDLGASERLQALFAFVSSNGSKRVLMVDDAPLLDEVSAAAIYQLVRVYGLACVMTARPSKPLAGPLARLVDEELVDVIDITGLDREVAQEVVRRTLGGPVDPDSMRALVGLADGNPLFLRELVVAAVNRGVEVGRLGFVVDPAGLPPRLRDSIAERFEDLSPQQREVAELLAVGEPWPPRLLGEPDAVASLEALGLVRTADSGSVLLAHPAFGETLRDLMPGELAEERKIEAARRLAESGGEDESFRALCLLAETSAPVSAANLSWAATYADSLDDHALALRLAHLALEREPDFFSALVRARSLSATGRLDEADSAFDEAERLAADDDQRSRLGTGRGFHLAIRRQRPKAAVQMGSVLISPMPDSPARRFLQADIAKWRIIAGETVPFERAGGHPDVLDAASEFNELTSRLIAAMFASDLETAETVITRARLLVDETRLAVPHGSDLVAFGEFMAKAQRGPLLSVLAEVDLRSLENTAAFGLWNWGMGWLTLHAGHALEALEFARVAVEQLAWRDFIGVLGMAEALRATAAAQLGQAPLAESILGRMHPEVLDQAAVVLQAAEARAWLLARAGDVDGAVTVIRSAVERGVEAQYYGPAALTAYVAVRLGRPDAVIDLLREIGAVAQGGVVAGIVQHAESLLAKDEDVVLAAAVTVAAIGLRSGAVDAARQATVLARSRGRTEVARRAALLASEWEVGLSGYQPTAQPSRADDLTERELLVARAAAGRERSKEIAERLGVSARTVDNHLSSIYRKLGVSNRDELRAELHSLE